MKEDEQINSVIFIEYFFFPWFVFYVSSDFVPTQSLSAFVVMVVCLSVIFTMLHRICCG